MDTQIVRHDAPYNIICGNNGRFALHVATLIVVKEKIGGVIEGAPMSDTFAIASYPVVAGSYEMDGQVWTKTELKDCLVICREKESITLYTLKKVMSFCDKRGFFRYKERILSSFVMALATYDINMYLPTDDNNKVISDYEVYLEFEPSEHGMLCMAYSSMESDFYFYECYVDDTADHSHAELINRNDAIKSMVRLRDAYLQMFRSDGLRSIKFSTKKEMYQDFVDELNNYKVDEGL